MKRTQNSKNSRAAATIARARLCVYKGHKIQAGLPMTIARSPACICNLQAEFPCLLALAVA